MKIAYSLILLVIFFLPSCAPKEKISVVSYSLLETSFKIDDTSKTIVIKNKDDLVNLKSSQALNVDLNENTILGFKGQIGGCSDPDFDIRVNRDDSKKLYTVEANVQQNGFCKKLILYQKFIAIDKVKKNYEVVFITKDILEDETDLLKRTKK